MDVRNHASARGPGMHNSPAASAIDSTPRSTHSTALAIDVCCDGETVRATIDDTRDDVVSLFASLAENQQAQLADDAWFLGLRCVMNAHRLAAESRFEDVGRELAATFERQLTSHQERQQTAFLGVVKEYFDPRDGRVPARIDEFIRDGGALAQTMNRYLAPGGELEKTLTQSVGKDSPILRMLSPTETTGVVKLIEAKVSTALANGHQDLARALDPMAEDGTMARFLKHLREEMLEADTDRGKQLAAVSRALDANDESSALSRLLRETEASSRSLLRAVNGDDPTSALGAIKSSLVKLLDAQSKAQIDALEALDARQRRDALETREALARLEERRRVHAKSPLGGATFEAMVAEALGTMVTGAAVTLDATGGSVGCIQGCKVGDVVVRYTEGSAYAGSALVVEAKHDSSYSVSRAREELARARTNRNAGIGLFVMARSHAPAAFPAFARYGQDILVVWDETDPTSLAYLQCGLVLALALAARCQRPQTAGDIKALCKIEGRIDAEIKRLEKMRKLAERIRNDADSMVDEVRKGTQKLGALLRDTKSTLTALEVELEDGEAMNDEPLVVPMLEHCAAE